MGISLFYHCCPYQWCRTPSMALGCWQAWESRLTTDQMYIGMIILTCCVWLSVMLSGKLFEHSIAMYTCDTFPLPFAERTERGLEQWHPLQILLLRHAELWRGRRWRRSGCCATSSSNANPATQSTPARLARWQGKLPEGSGEALRGRMVDCST